MFLLRVKTRSYDIWYFFFNKLKKKKHFDFWINKYLLITYKSWILNLARRVSWDLQYCHKRIQLVFFFLFQKTILKQLYCWRRYVLWDKFMIWTPRLHSLFWFHILWKWITASSKVNIFTSKVPISFTQFTGLLSSLAKKRIIAPSLIA